MPGCDTLDKSPGDRGATNAEIVVEGLEDVLGNIDVANLAAHALVADSGEDDPAVGLELDTTVAERVVVGAGAHLQVRESEDATGASVVRTASTDARSEVSDVAVEGTGRHVLAGENGVVGEGALADAGERIVSQSHDEGMGKKRRRENSHVALGSEAADNEDLGLGALVDLSGATANLGAGGPHELGCRERKRSAK